MTVSLFASELRRARESRGWSREQLAAEMNFSASLIDKIERDQRPPTKPFAESADAALKLDGLLERIRRDSLRQHAVPDWLRPWDDILHQATTLRVFNPLVVPGLLQTERYARAQLRSGDPEQTDDRVVARMERQRELFTREKPPTVAVLLDETVLRRQLGDPATMREQLIHLTECPAGVQVVPTGAETCLGLDGAFEYAALDGHGYVYVETPARGFLLDDREVVSQVAERWGTLVAEALPLRQSRDLIMGAAETWKS